MDRHCFGICVCSLVFVQGNFGYVGLSKSGKLRKRNIGREGESFLFINYNGEREINIATNM